MIFKGKDAFLNALSESLSEKLYIAEVCFNKKENGGIYGYPCSFLLFSLIETIGSFYKGKNINIIIDGKSKIIKKTNEFFYILNSANYFNQKLSEKEINNLYDNYRSPLTHNSVLPINHSLWVGIDNNIVLDYEKEWPRVNLTALLNLCKLATKNFLNELPQLLIENSQMEDLLKKKFK